MNPPLFTFLQINDLHVSHKDLTGEAALHSSTGYPGGVKRLRWLLNRIRTGSLPISPDFILSLGDQIHGIIPENVLKDNFAFRSLMGNLPCPLYPLMGNHENIQQEGHPGFVASFEDTFGFGSNYTFLFQGIRFVMLDNSGTANRKNISMFKKRAAWFEETLQTFKHEKKIICCHVPLVPIRDLDVLRQSFGFTSYMTREPEILDLVRANSENILAVLSGHIHLTGMVIDHGVYHIDISGLASYPGDFGLFTVYKDHVEVDIQSVPSELQVAESNIHGKIRHGKDFTDSGHRTHEEYLKGLENERFFTILHDCCDVAPLMVGG